MFSYPSHFQARAHNSIRAIGVSGLAVLWAAGAHAQSAPELAYQAYEADLEKLGLVIDSGAIRFDEATNTLTVEDLTIKLAGSLELPGNDATDKLTYSIEQFSESMTMVGVTHSSGTYFVREWAYSDNTKITIDARVESKFEASFEARFNGVSGLNYEFAKPEFPDADPARPVSRWLPYLETAMGVSFDEIILGATGMTFEAIDKSDGKDTLLVSGTIQVDDYRMLDQRDGLLREYAVGAMSQNLQIRDEASGAMLNQTTSQGRTIYENMDLAAFLDIFDPDVPETGEEIRVLGSMSAIDYVNTQEIDGGKATTLTVGEASARDIFFIKRDNNILEMLDRLVSGQEPNPAELITNVFQLYRSFHITDARVADVRVSFPDPDSTGGVVDMKIGEMAMTDVGPDGVGEMLMVGLEVPNLPDGGSAKLDWASISDIEFADFGPIRSMIAKLTTDPLFATKEPLEVARAFAPRSFAYELAGLEISTTETGTVSLDSTEMAVSTSVPPVPTTIYSKTNNLSIPVANIEEDEVKQVLTALGLKDFTVSSETRMYWDEATLELRLERLMLDIEGIGKAEASAHLANIPRSVFEDPENQLQLALFTAQFIEAEITFADAGLAKDGIAVYAEQQGLPENVFREALAAQAAESAAMLRNEAFTQMVQDAVSTFLADPRQLRLTVKPETPVPFAQILGSMAAPQVIPGLLNVELKAN